MSPDDGANFVDGTIKVMLGSDNLILSSSILDYGGKDGVLVSEGKLPAKLGAYGSEDS